MHIAMNMLSTVALSGQLERELGTLRHVHSVAWAILCSNSIYMIVAYLLSILFMYDHLMYQHSVGFSGILFHMLVLECQAGGSRNIFGVVSVPAWVYPWVL